MGRRKHLRIYIYIYIYIFICVKAMGWEKAVDGDEGREVIIPMSVPKATNCSKYPAIAMFPGYPESQTSSAVGKSTN